MKIAYVLDDSLDKPDGVQQYVLTVGQWMSDQGHDVIYLTGQTERGDIEGVYSLSRNINVHFNQNRMSTPLPASKKRIRHLLNELKVDVLHVQLPYSPFLASRVINSATPSTAVIGTFHILPYSRLESAATRLLAATVRRSRRRFDNIVSVSLPAKEFAASRFKVASQVLPNAVPVKRFSGGRKYAKYDDGKLNIVYLGRLVERKGCMCLMRALKLLNDQGKLRGVRVIIAGKGPLQQNLEKFVSSNNLTGVVEFVGFVSEDEKPNLLASADIAVLPSIGGESFGIVLVEAMAAGSDVVIAGDNHGYRTVMSGHERQLVDPESATGFAKVLEYYLANKSARRSAKRWQQDRASEYDVDNVGRELTKIYKLALRNRKNMR